MENKPEELKKIEEEIKATPKIRQIIIETDGKQVRLTKAEVAGEIELVAILQLLIDFINKTAVAETKKEEKKATE